MKKALKFIIFILIILIFSIPFIIKKTYPLTYFDIVKIESKKYNLDPYLINAIIKTESNFNIKALSCKQAYGLMQITPDTGKWISEQMKLKDFSLEKMYDPEYNISMGCWYINNLKKEFDDNIDLVLAAYNGGRGNVQKWLNDNNHSKDGKNLHYIPFKETDKYVKKVKFNYSIYKYLYDK
ncbi:lytic transglycosylase domain-containing protein [Clostridium rectalis]|uniref:lytic transglycosylase domain-containing protein n=1 Tax=Clostridium rectalis TaxID=2040295 RepID=UPI000F634A96|nr:lytic transglycosylase domain-containing protein [Clostridium rectalis]